MLCSPAQGFQEGPFALCHSNCGEIIKQDAVKGSYPRLR